jgi:hypothetical protein
VRGSVLSARRRGLNGEQKSSARQEGEPAAVACHDIVVLHMGHNIAGGACAEQGQVWNIDPEQRGLLVNAWYTGGVDVIDFSKPTRLKEIAYYDPARNSGTWSAYPYAGPLFAVSGPSFDQT